MKKLFSAVLALTMVASTFVTTAFAAGTNFAIKANKATYDEGASVTVTVTITGETFNGFATTLSYDPEIFTWDKGAKPSSSTLSGSPVFGNNAELGEAYATYGVASNEETEIEFEDEDTGDIEMKPATWTYQYRFKVKSDVKAGDYTFTLTEKGEGNMNSEEGALAVSFSAPVTVHVNGTKTDEVPKTLTATVDEEIAEVVAPSGKTTYGISGVVSGGALFNTLVLTVNELTNGKTAEVDFNIGTAIEANDITFGLNIWGAPADIDFSATAAASLVEIAE